MSKNLRWRGLIIAILIVVAMIYLVPSLPGDLPKWWSNPLPDEKVHLGLDLQGGIHLVLEVKVLEAIKKHLDITADDLRENLREERIKFKDRPKRDGLEGIDITLIKEDQTSAFLDIVKANFRNFDLKAADPGKDRLSYKLVLKQSARNDIIEKANEQARETITNRIDQFGVAEADIRLLENNRIQIQLPGVKDPERAKELIKQVAVLEFKLVDDKNSVDDALKGNIPPGDEILYEVSHDQESGIERKIPYLVKKRSLLTGDYITGARASMSSQYNEPEVIMSFNSQGEHIFERITGANVGRNLAIVLDGHVKSAPRIRQKISGNASISGSMTMDDARDLAIVLRAGSLPAPVNFIEERTVGPSLGHDSIVKGFYSMIIGTIIVIVFMAIYYGLSGLIADIALLLNVLFIMAGLAFFEATLTLPGIAGIILTIGMAVDANVLIFERIREELKLGKTPRTAIESGFSKAVVTILDANATTFIAALVLFQFGTGPVKGFAVTLSIGIVASFITAVFVARVIFDYLYINLNWKKISI